MRPNTLTHHPSRKPKLSVIFGLGVVLLTAVALQPGLPNLSARAATPSNSHRLPVFFIANNGQAAEEVRYLVNTPDLKAHFASSEIVLNLQGRTVQVRFPNGSLASRIEALDQLESKVNFILGNDPDEWWTGIPTYGRIAYRDVYPGIDVIYGAAQGHLKSEFVIAPGSDPETIRCKYSGVDGLRIDDKGTLILAVGSQELREEKPQIYQQVDEKRVLVDGVFRLLGNGEVGFAIGAYDRTRPLIIDPLLSYSSYLGGSGLDSGKSIAVDGAGNAYITGYTDSLDFPMKSPLQGNGGGVDVFVAKLDVSGRNLIYCTYLGGGWDDRGFGIAVDGGGNAYVTGWTSSPNFPTTSGARQRALGGGRDAFVLKLSSSGSGLIFSTYVGGSNHDSGNAIAVDSSGNAYVAGDSYSGNFPVISAFQSSSQGRQDAFAFKLSNGGSALLWSTYLGGYGDDRANGIAVDGSGNAYVAGGADSANFPTFNAVQGGNRGGQDAFITKLSADGQSLIYSTYLGGSGGTLGANEMATGVAVDAAGNVYVTGVTSSLNFPVVNALQPGYRGGALDAFVAKLNPTGSTLIYSTYLGGASVDYAFGIAVNAAGTVCIVGYTSSSDFPTVSPLQASNAGNYDAFVVKLTAQGSALESVSYWGGGDSDIANAVFMDPAGNVWITGQTLSTNFPLKNAIQSLNAGSLGAFVTKMGEITPTAVFRATNGNTQLISYGRTGLANAGGYITCEPGISRSAAGDTFVVGRNETTRVYLNIFKQDTQTWTGWIFAGDQKYGDPAVAAISNGEAYIVARDTSYRYWLSHYRPGQGFEGWLLLGGDFVTEPSIAAGKDDSVYIAGAAGNGVVSAGRYVPGPGFQGWIPGGSYPAAAGKPAITVGADGAAYVAIKATTNGVRMARFEGSTWGTWYNGGGNIGKGPDLAATGGVIYVVVTTPAGAVYVQSFTEGTGNGWQGAWTFLNGHLERAAIGAVKGRYYIAGRSLMYYNLWWYESGVGWSCLGHPGLAASELVAGPR